MPTTARRACACPAGGFYCRIRNTRRAGDLVVLDTPATPVGARSTSWMLRLSTAPSVAALYYTSRREVSATILPGADLPQPTIEFETADARSADEYLTAHRQSDEPEPTNQLPQIDMTKWPLSGDTTVISRRSYADGCQDGHAVLLGAAPQPALGCCCAGWLYQLRQISTLVAVSTIPVRRLALVWCSPASVSDMLDAMAELDAPAASRISPHRLHPTVVTTN